MSWPGSNKPIALVAGGGLAVLALVVALRYTELGRAVTWQKQASPGRLSSAHSFLENDCAGCHTTFRGPDPAKCIACHANDAVLQRQPTAFHAGVGSCRECHPEHQDRDRPPTSMDHAALAQIGIRQLHEKGDAADFVAWIRHLESEALTPQANPRITGLESALNCAACHSNKDPHFKLFGQDCAQCHAVDGWTIPEFRHPSPRSTDCAQCHQAPPSHYMGHFHMISAKVAGKPHARVDQCYQCHQTTSWNDIKGVGWYKHH
jgi:hypothetical protein